MLNFNILLDYLSYEARYFEYLQQLEYRDPIKDLDKEMRKLNINSLVIKKLKKKKQIFNKKKINILITVCKIL